MGRGLDEKELRRRAIEGVRDEVEAFGSGAPDSLPVRREGLLASIAPASPQRSLFNSVYYDDPAALAAEVDALEQADRAYGYESDGFAAGIARETRIRWHGAFAAGEPVGCLGTIEVGDDCLVTGVATPPEHRGRGIASWLLWQALAEAGEGGLTSASLQASRSGAPLYERIGFRDLGFIEMWEMRR